MSSQTNCSLRRSRSLARLPMRSCQERSLADGASVMLQTSRRRMHEIFSFRMKSSFLVHTNTTNTTTTSFVLVLPPARWVKCVWLHVCVCVCVWFLWWLHQPIKLTWTSRVTFISSHLFSSQGVLVGLEGFVSVLELVSRGQACNRTHI